MIHEPDCFVWHPGITSISHFGLFRVCYYTIVKGDDNRVEEIKQRLSKIVFNATSIDKTAISGQVVPVVFKKPQQGKKTRIVDLHLIIDVLRYAHLNAIEIIYLASGDGDYLPLVKEVMREGKQVFVGALASGLAKPLTYTCDEFFELDKFFFKPSAESAT